MRNITIDTNVFIDNPNIIEQIEKSNIFIPFVVLEELDKHKKDRGLTGANVRLSIRNLEKYIENPKTELGSKIHFVDVSENNIGMELINDNIILATAIAKKSELWTNDVALRVKASFKKVKCVGVSDDICEVEEIYSGIKEVMVLPEVIDELHSSTIIDSPEEFIENQYIRLVSIKNEKHTGMARYINGKLCKIISLKNVSGISPRNMAQAFALDALLDPALDCVSLMGKSGCGKTLISLAAAVDQTMNNKEYDRIMLVKPPVPAGPDIGFLPGEAYDKLLPHYESFIDNLYHVFPSYKNNDIMHHLLNTGKLLMTPPTYMRGRSLERTVVIVDEAQNLKKEEMKTIATRLGEGSKLIIMGDINQVDRVGLDSFNNGLSYFLDKFIGQKCFAHIKFTKGERSGFSELAADLL